MKKFITSVLIISTLISCSKSNGSNDGKKRTLQVLVQDYNPPAVMNHYWAVKLIFNPQVTLTGSVKVEYDVYNLNAFYKHYSYKFPFSLNNENTFIYNTNVNSQLQGPEIRNLVVDSLQTTGDYIIELK